MQTKPFSLKDYPFRKGRQLLLRKNLPIWLWVGNRGLSAIVIYLVILIVFPNIERVIAPRTHLLTIFGAFVSLAVTNTLVARKVSAKANGSPLFTGHPSIKITEDELIISSDEETLARKWSAVAEVVKTREGFVILSKHFAFMPVPTSAFSDKAEMTAFAEAINVRIFAAKDRI